MKKKELIKSILVLCSLIITFIAAVLVKDSFDYDTIWCFSFASKIVDGYVPYRDYNMVITPLFAQISAGIMYIFGNKLFVFLIIGAVYGALIIWFEYLIITKLRFHKKGIFLFLMFETLMISAIIVNSYNILVMLFNIILIYIEINKIRCEKYEEITKKCKKTKLLNIKCTTLYNVIMGLILGLIFITKQNYGAIIILGITVYNFMKALCLKKQKVSKSFWDLCTMAFYCLIPILIEEIYLYNNGALYNAIDYLFGGLGAFGKQNFYSIFEGYNIETYASIAISIFLILLAIFKVKGSVQRKFKMKNELLLFLSIFGIVSFVYVIPLGNEYHIAVMYIVNSFYLYLTLMSFNGISNFVNKQMSALALGLAKVMPALYGSVLIIMYINMAHKFTNIPEYNKFENVFVTYEAELNVRTVNTWRKAYKEYMGAPLYFMTSDSALYSLIANENNDIFDLPLRGNLGKEDYVKLMKKIYGADKCYIAIYDDETRFWQEPIEAAAYIRSNYKKIDSFKCYEVYEIK